MGSQYVVCECGERISLRLYQQRRSAKLHRTNLTRSTYYAMLRLTGWSTAAMEIKMTLLPKAINGHEYYTDDEVYYTFHQVKAATDTLWSFACLELGITKKTGFDSKETKDITDLAGIGPLHPTRFLLLKNGEAIPVPYLANGSANLRPNDIILRSAGPTPTIPPIPTGVPSTVSTESVVDRLKKIEDLHNRKFLNDMEYQEKRAKIMDEL